MVFSTQQGLSQHQSWTTINKIGCHHAQTLTQKSEFLEKSSQRKELISGIKIKDIPCDADLYAAPHSQGSSIDAKEKTVYFKSVSKFWK